MIQFLVDVFAFIIIKKNFYGRWCFACMHVCMRVSGTQGLDLQTVWAAMWMLEIETRVLLEELPVFSTTESFLQSQCSCF